MIDKILTSYYSLNQYFTANTEH